MNKQISSGVGIAIIAILAAIIALFFRAYQEVQAPIQSVQSPQARSLHSRASDQEAIPSTIQPQSQAAQPAQKTNNSAASPNTSVDTSTNTVVSSKSAILFTIKDQGGKLLSGITCATKADEGDTRMIPEISTKSDAKGQCSFQNLDPAFPYVVRVYWTKDKSRVSDVSLSWIPAGTTAARTVVKPF